MAEKDRDDGERIARIETLIETSLENQRESRERANRMAGDIQALRDENGAIRNRLESALALESRVASVERTQNKWQEKWAAVAWVLKWTGYIATGAFGVMLAVGDRIAKIAAFLWGVK